MSQFQQTLNIELALRSCSSLFAPVCQLSLIFDSILSQSLVLREREFLSPRQPSSGCRSAFLTWSWALGGSCWGSAPAQLTLDTRMVGITYRSASARPSLSSSNSKLPLLPQTEKQQSPDREPAPSFKDKETYQELFKPLPKPEPIPAFTQFKVRYSIYLNVNSA